MQPVGIPAGADPGIVAHLPERVTFQREAEQLEPSRFQREHARGVELDREGGGARAVLAVAPVALTARVVQEPEEEQKLGVCPRLVDREVEAGRRDCVPVLLSVHVRIDAPGALQHVVDDGEIRLGHARREE